MGCMGEGLPSLVLNQFQIGIISDFRGHALETSGDGLQTDNTLVFY